MIKTTCDHTNNTCTRIQTPIIIHAIIAFRHEILRQRFLITGNTQNGENMTRQHWSIMTGQSLPVPLRGRKNILVRF